MRSFGKINTEMNDKNIFIKKDFDDNIKESNENDGQRKTLYNF